MRTDPVVDGSITPARKSVQVFIHHDGSGEDEALGDARHAVHDPRLTPGDRAAIRNTLTAVDYVQDRFGYRALQDPEHAVQLVLHAASGPAASIGRILVPSDNPFTGMPHGNVRRDVLLPPRVAEHELIHILQEAISGHPIGPRPDISGHGADVVSPYQAHSVAEGLADSFAALHARSWNSGGAFFDPKRGPIRVARDFDDPDSPASLSHVRETYDPVGVRDLTVDPHLQGGVVVLTVKAIEERLGWHRTQDLLWDVLNDPTFSRFDGDWGDLTRTLEGIASERSGSEPEVSRAIRGALRETGLNTVE